MVFAGNSRFKPIRLLGTGSAGSVYLVHDEHLDREVALKTLALSSGVDLYRFKREFRTLADLEHPNLVTLHELISDGSSWFFTMEYVEGLPFDRFLLGRPPVLDAGVGIVAAERARPESPASIVDDRLLRSVQQLCAGVQAMHEIGCVHRDLKPTNVLVTEAGRVVILDFGLTQKTGAPALSGGGVSGTPAYMAPEQALDRSGRPAADWYAVGTMIYEVLTGRCPFEGVMFDVLLRKQTEDPPPPTQVNPHADELLGELCMRMLQRDETQRPSGREILVRLGGSGGQTVLPPLKRHTPFGTLAMGVPGREQELQELLLAYARTRKGQLSVVTVQGSSGIGKTCLVETFLANVEGEDALVLRGRCHERETMPFKALDSVVDVLSHRLAELSSEDQSYVLPDSILCLSEVFPVLRRLKLTGHQRYFLPQLRDAKEVRNQAFLAFCELLRRLARLQSVVIFIDDLQWADRDSYALLRALTQQPGAPPVLLITAIRRAPEGAAADPLLRELEEQPGITHIALGPLPPDSTRELVDHQLSQEDIEPEVLERVADAVVRESGGNPFFAIELVHHLRTVVLPRGNPNIQVDEGVRLDRMILERVGNLPVESQRLLQVVAVAGDPLPQHAIAAAADMVFGSDTWQRSVAALVDQCLVRRGGRQGEDLVEPYHDRIREAVTGGLDEAAARQVNARLARAIDVWDSERTDMLARYWMSAGDRERAKHYACEAATDARAKLAFDRAADLYETAAGMESDGVARASLLRSAGECRASGGLAIMAAEAYQRAAALCDSVSAARLQQLAAEQLLRGGMIAQGLEILKRVLEGAGLRLAARPTKALLSVFLRTLWLRLRGLKFRERPAEAITPGDQRRLDILWSATVGLGVVDTLRADDFLLRFLLRALKVGDVRRVAQGLAVLSGQLAALGRKHFSWASLMVAEAEVLARRTGHPPTIGLARMCRGIARYFAGEFDSVADELLEVENYILRHCHGMGWELATSRSFACFSLRLCGRLRELCDRFDRYTADADRTGDHYLATNLRTYQSVVWLIRDDVARAAKGIAGALDSWPADLYHVQHFFYLYARCEQAMYAEQPELAWQAIVADAPALARSGLLRVSGIRIENAWLRGRVALALAEKEPAAARGSWLRVVERSVGLLRKSEHQTGVSMGLVLEAATRWLSPNTERERVLVALERAVATAESARAILIAESARRWLGEILGGRRGEEIRARSNGWMAAQGVLNPARLAHLVAPGFRTGDIASSTSAERLQAQKTSA